MLFCAVIGAKDVQTPSFRHIQRQAGGDNRVKRAETGIQSGIRGHQRQIVLCGKTCGILQRQHQCSGQQAGRFDHRDSRAMQISGSFARGLQGAFHGRTQIISRVSNCAHPMQRRIGRQDDSRNILIIGARLKRLGAPSGYCKHGLPAQSPQVGQAHGIQSFCRQHQRPTVQHDRNTHPQICACTGQSFCNVGCKSHRACPFHLFQ